jgi:hypothetical protein
VIVLPVSYFRHEAGRILARLDGTENWPRYPVAAAFPAATDAFLTEFML